MTPEQKMQKVAEAAGECWHIKGNVCLICGLYGVAPAIHINPSPTDLNELFRLAEPCTKRSRINNHDENSPY